MPETLKTRIILILSVLSAILFIGTIGSCSNAGRQKGARDKEMLIRLDLEEKMSKSGQEKGALTDKLNAANAALEEERAAHEAAKKVLTQEQLINQSLKEELQKVTKLKEALEEDLKEALIKGKVTKTKR